MTGCISSQGFQSYKLFFEHPGGNISFASRLVLALPTPLSQGFPETELAVKSALSLPCPEQEFQQEGRGTGKRMVPTRGPDLSLLVNLAGGHILPAGIPAPDVDGRELYSLKLSHRAASLRAL